MKIEVFRELLVRFDGLSRLQVCVEQLLRHKEEWVAGRWNVPTGSAGSGNEAVAPSSSEADGDEVWVPRHEQFRTDEYKASVRSALSKEFSSLSRSAVDAVLAEVNFCYIRARPILRDLSSKTWRATFNSILPFKSKKDKQINAGPCSRGRGFNWLNANHLSFEMNQGRDVTYYTYALGQDMNQRET